MLFINNRICIAHIPVVTCFTQESIMFGYSVSYMRPETACAAEVDRDKTTRHRETQLYIKTNLFPQHRHGCI